MNEEQERLLDVLTRATAPGQGPGAPLDGETAELRQTWLALGRLLQGGQEAGAPAVAFPPSPPARRRVGIVAAVLALAAAILVALTFLARAGSDGAGERARAKPQATAAPSANLPASASANADPGAELAWDDRLDERISQVGRRLRGIEGDWSLYGRDYALMQAALEQFEQDMQGETL